jgi:orotate phosphoribosyltransferase
VVVIEDLISTGGSSLNAVNALRESHCDVLGWSQYLLMSLKKLSDAFVGENCSLNTLSNYSILVETALKTGYIGQEEVETLKKWRLDPAGWGGK